MTTDDYESLDELKEQKRPRSPSPIYDFGKPIGNTGVIYWGQEKVVKGDRTAMCVCPICGELWRVKLYAVSSGRTSSCGCKKA